MACVIEDVTNKDPSENDDALHRILTSNGDDVQAFMRNVCGFLKRRTSFFKTEGAEKVLTKVVREYSGRSGGVKSGFFGAKSTSVKSTTASASTAQTSAPSAAAEPTPAAAATSSAPAPDPEAPEPAVEATPVPDADEDEGTGEAPNSGNGLDLDRYCWTQTLSEVSLNVKVPAGTRGRDCCVDIGARKLKVGLKGQEPVLDGLLHGDVVVDDCYWNCDGKVIEVSLQKKDRMNWWSTVVQGEPEVNTRKVAPENSKLDDLDRDTRQTVEKMMFDQRQKALGKPTSDQMQQQEMLAKFMKAHPEMDFSNAKIM